MIDVLTVVITGLTSQKRESVREERGREKGEVESEKGNFGRRDVLES